MIKQCPTCKSTRLIRGINGVKCKNCGYVNIKDVNNYICNARESTRKAIRDYVNLLEEYLDIDISKIKAKNKKLLLRNCVHPKVGLHIFNCAYKEKQEVLI